VKINKLSIVFLSLAFFLSGVASLIYQVSWQRILILHSGVGIYSVSIIVASFMAGLGFGSYYGGIFSSKYGKAEALWVFAFIELSICLLGLISSYVYYDLIYMNFSFLYSKVLFMIPTHLITLFIPTFLMGMSLPFLIQGTVRNPKNASSTIGVLYGINIIGAAIGSFISPWLIIPEIGIKGAIYCAALCNFMAFLFTFMGRNYSSDLPDSGEDINGKLSLESDPIANNSLPFKYWLILYSLSGFIALSLEIIWFRIIDVAVKANSFTFGTILSIYLFGLCIGTFIGSKTSKNCKNPLNLFLKYQTIILLYTCLSILLVIYVPEEFPMIDIADSFWAGYELEGRDFLLFQLYISLYYCLIPTIFMGLSFTVLHKAVQNDSSTIGKKVGILQASNIVGNVLGSILVGLVLFNLLGTSGTIKFILLVGLAFPIFGIFSNKKRILFAILSALLFLLILIMPSQNKLWARFHAAEETDLLFKEDSSGLMSLVKLRGGAFFYFINGKYHSKIPFGGHNSYLGTIGTLIHPDPNEICIIGLGCGDTAWAAGCREETSEIVVYEIALATDLLKDISEDPNSDQLKKFLEDNRYKIYKADGRNALAHQNRNYDIIEADALRPHSAYAGNLYSKEFFELCKSRLNDGGMMVQWNSSSRVEKTFGHVFPYVYKIGVALIGTLDPLDFNKDQVLQRLDSQFTTDYFGADVTNIWKKQIARTEMSPLIVDREDLVDVNTDLFPIDEFRIKNHFYKK